MWRLEKYADSTKRIFRINFRLIEREINLKTMKKEEWEIGQF
jgi:hypothetical protein